MERARFCRDFSRHLRVSLTDPEDTTVQPHSVDGCELGPHPQSMEKQTAYFWGEAIHK